MQEETRKYHVSRKEGYELVKHSDNSIAERRKVKIKDTVIINNTLYFITENEIFIPWYNLEFSYKSKK